MDILTVKQGIIVHQVNCQGVMGCGIALKIRRKWPVVFERYRKYKFNLGMVQMVQVEPGLYVCNLAGQDRYGREKRHTDYEALRAGLRKVANWASKKGLQVFIPFKMGCANAGGDWNIVSKIIDQECPRAQICTPS